MIIVKEGEPLFFRDEATAQSMLYCLEKVTDKNYEIIEARKEFSSIKGFVIRVEKTNEDPPKYRNFKEFIENSRIHDTGIAKTAWNAAIYLAVEIVYYCDENNCLSDLSLKLNELKEY